MSIEPNYTLASPNRDNSLDATLLRNETPPSKEAFRRQLYNELCLQWNISMLVDEQIIKKKYKNKN
jgi:hypothetical protein